MVNRIVDMRSTPKRCFIFLGLGLVKRASQAERFEIMAVVLVAGKIHHAGLDLLRSRDDISVIYVEAVTTEAYLRELPGADALLIRTQPLTAVDIATATKLKIVSRHGVGYDAVDVAALNARKIPLAIVGDVNSRAVAEHTLMLMLTAARRAIAHHIASTTGNWNERNRFDSTELDGKILLILGFGRIGRRVAELAKAFGMIIRAYDPYVTAAQMDDVCVLRAESLTSDLAMADFVSVHMPGGQNGAIIGAAEFEMMKPSVIIVNAARGGIIDEVALDAALRQRKLRAAALDVLTTEPPTAEHPLLTNPYVTISPHNAGLTEECAMRMSLSAAQNILDAFDGKLDSKLVVNANAM
jgi:D-3-phosphoglycerate dehydrogenase / 2-oxoglutarate reductase